MKYLVETTRIAGPGSTHTVEQYLNEKPRDWKLVQWRWIFLPYTDNSPQNLTLHTEGDYNGVEATWEVP
jgi:hypothetical protein